MSNFQNLEAGKKFSSAYQPTPEQKAAGWTKKRMLKELLNLCLTGEDIDSVKERELLGGLLGLAPDELKGMTFEESIDLRQIQRARHETRAWKAIKDTLHRQEIGDGEVITRTIINVNETF